jgi:hypothetical protein
MFITALHPRIADFHCVGPAIANVRAFAPGTVSSFALADAGFRVSTFTL